MAEREVNERIDMRLGQSWTTIAPLASPAELGMEKLFEKFLSKPLFVFRPPEPPVLGQKQEIPGWMFPRQNQFRASGTRWKRKRCRVFGRGKPQGKHPDPARDAH